MKIQLHELELQQGLHVFLSPPPPAVNDHSAIVSHSTITVP
jgi:hypothetical protein